MSEKSEADSIPHKVGSSLLLGDDTWAKLYNFSKAITCRSFDVADLDSCDSAVIDNLLNETTNNHYHLLVGHMLGLDHIGHTYGSVATSKMDAKLGQLEEFIESVVGRLSEDTVLLVVGDHGMKADGNHGGISDD